MKLRALLVLLLASGCASQQVASNGCDVAARHTPDGGTEYVSGIDESAGVYPDFAMLALHRDSEVVAQRKAGVISANKQLCAIRVMLSKGPSFAVENLNAAAQGKRKMCGQEYVEMVGLVQASWKDGEFKAAVDQACGAA